MRVKIWRVRGADRKPDHESPVWNDLEAHARDLEAMGRQIRHDAARRVPSAMPGPNRPFGQRMHQPRAIVPGLKTPSL
jgi:hypothetical protein